MSVELFTRFDRRALAALLRRDVPRVRAAQYFSKVEGATADEAAQADADLPRWDAYFAGFAKLADAKCLCCGTGLAFMNNDGLSLLIGGGFAWGMASGEGHCRYCLYPMRGHHHVEGLGSIRNLFLPYHPTVLALAPERYL